MKRTRTISVLLLLALVLTLCVGAFSGCTLLTADGSTDTSSQTVSNVQISEGNIIVTYSDGTTKNIGSATTNVNNNTITINGGETEQSTLAVSKALLSTVGVQCSFTRTVQGGFWGSSSQQSYTSNGAGVIYSLDKTSGNAYIITNYHVVHDSDSNAANGISTKIAIFLWGAQTGIPANYVGGSSNYDIAVLEVKNNDLLKTSAAEAADITDSDAISVGQNVYVVGNPEAEGISATAGIVSVDSEYISMSVTDNYGATSKVQYRVIRVDAAVNSGNSGGGLFDASGRLIGIVNAKIQSEEVENIGYAIPSNVASAVARNIIDYAAQGKTNVVRAIVGITVTISDSRMVYDTETGLVHMEQTICVDSVEDGSLAKNAGVQAGDVLVSIKVGSAEAQTVSRQHHIIDAMLDARVNDTVELIVMRNGEQKTLTMTVTADCLKDY